MILLKKLTKSPQLHVVLSRKSTQKVWASPSHCSVSRLLSPSQSSWSAGPFPAESWADPSLSKPLPPVSSSSYGPATSPSLRWRPTRSSTPASKNTSNSSLVFEITRRRDVQNFHSKIVFQQTFIFTPNSVWVSQSPCSASRLASPSRSFYYADHLRSVENWADRSPSRFWPRQSSFASGSATS